MKKIKGLKALPGKIPNEFQYIGMIEGIYALTNKMDHCNPNTPRWPPISNVQVFVGVYVESCKDTCVFQVFVGVYVESCKDTCVFQVFVGVYVESCKDTCVFQVFVGVYVESCKDTCVFQVFVGVYVE